MPDDVVNLPGDLVTQRGVVRRLAAGPQLAALRHQPAQPPGGSGDAQLSDKGLRHVLSPEGERDDSQLIPVPVPRAQCRADDDGSRPDRRELAPAPPADRIEGRSDRKVRRKRGVDNDEL